MNLKEIREMISLMNENDLTEIEVEREGTKIKIRKGSAEVFEPVHKSPAGYHVETQPLPPAGDEAASAENANRKEIKSPMVGTFYRAPSPGSKPYTDVGKTVNAGEVICIIEAMKLMNEIKAEVSGKIVAILMENGHPVEFGQALFRIEPL